MPFLSRTGDMIAMSTKQHLDNLIQLRAELIKERRACVSNARSGELPEIVARIEAVDKSILDEKKLIEIL